jgi:Ner family transcriptional regulator
MKTSPTSAISQDWHPADIKASLEKKGWSLRRLAAANGYAPNSLHMVFRERWFNAEKIVADVIGVSAATIWPSRYNVDGSPKKRMYIVPRATPIKFNTANVKRNVNNTAEV